MRFLKRSTALQILTRGAKVMAFAQLLRAKFHSHLKPPRANQILKGHLTSNSAIKALLFFLELLRNRTSIIDSYTLLFVVKACTQKPLVTEGKQTHALVIKLGYEHIISLQTSLVGMYSSVGNLSDAHHVFEEIPKKNVVCWTALISAFVANQKPSKALMLFRRMQLEKLEPDQVTVTVALSACADLGALDMGEWIHGYICRKKKMNRDLCLNNALINMYTKCGDIRTARNLFYNMKEKDVTTWTSMIVGHAIHGQAEEALRLFANMKGENRNAIKKLKHVSGDHFVPNDVTFIGVLMACSHAGMVEEGRHQFKSMTNDYALKPRHPHFGCMVDLFCRAGRLKEAYDFIFEMSVHANAVVWRTLLGACSIHGSIELAAEARHHLFELEDCLPGDNVIMSNIYAANGLWNKKMCVREEIKQRRAPGCSSIELGSCIYEFITADDSHPQTNEIHIVLGLLCQNLRTYGYVPELLNPTET